jgi:hypothetical protein
MPLLLFLPPPWPLNNEGLVATAWGITTHLARFMWPCKRLCVAAASPASFQSS